MNRKRDALKWVFLIPRIFLEPLGLWPEKQQTWKRALFFIMLTVCCIEEYGHLFYMIQNKKKINEIPPTVICITTVFQGISKITTLHIHTKTLAKMREMVRVEFWPCDLFGKKTEHDLKKMGKAASIVMIFVYSTAVVYFIGLFVIPLSNGDYKLPLNTAFGFNYTFSPIFEFFYITQCWTNIFVVMHGIRGHDDLFVALTTNCIGQFKLLKKAVSYIGTGKENRINSVLDEIETQRGYQYHKYKRPEIRLLLRCIEHHKRLLQFCDYTEKAFSTSLCVQLFVSVAAICVSSFALIVIDVKMTEMFGLFAYCIGHITQLFIFCVLGNEITDSTATFGDDVYKCGWQNQRFSTLRKALPLIILHADKRPKKITALGIVSLNNSSFIKVMRLSFSYHTLLSKMFERNQ